MSTTLPATVTVFHGNNRLEISERICSTIHDIDPTGLSTSVFENASTVANEVGAAAGSPGFFGADRLLICYNLVVPASGGRRRKQRDDDESDPLSALRNIAPGVHVVLVEDSLTRTDEKRLRQFASDVAVEKFDVPRGRGLIDWTCSRATVHRSSIDGATATRLVEALFPGTWRDANRRDDVPPDLYRLDSELAKLATSAGRDGEISSELVAALVPDAVPLDVWGLTNAIADRDQPRAIKQLERALENGQAPEMVMGQLAAQFETFAIVQAAPGLAPAEVASRSGLSEGRVRQAARSARNYSRDDLARALREIRDADFGIKQGHFEPLDALSFLVSGLSESKSPVRR